MTRFVARLFCCVLPLSLLAAAGCHKKDDVTDEAMRAGRDAASLKAADEDYFQCMDGGCRNGAAVRHLQPAEVQGRNTWIVWTGGNDRFWDYISKASVGTLDLLKVISTYPGKLQGGHDNRWDYFGLVTEPCFDAPGSPDPDRFGLRLDKRRADCPPDPFEDAKKYPGVEIGARGKNLPAGSYYGYATGIVGLRLFPNPDFDEKAAQAWSADRYYNDPSYYDSNNLVKPYRVGMSCGFCHVGPNPLQPPADPNHPKWEELSSNVGAQYFWVDRVLGWQQDPSSFPWQLFHTARPGALDTSLVSTDYINNPRTMNAIYGLQARLDMAKRWGKESLAGGNLNNKQFNDYVKSGPLTELYQAPSTEWTPRVLKDGSDSVGALGALNRVFINIGLFSEEWLLHFNPLVGGKPISPIEIAKAEKNSSYWQATEAQTINLAQFFLATTAPHLLKDAPGGAAYQTTDAAKLQRGKVVFAETCARCHSSKLPKPAQGLDPDGCAGAGYLDCWNRYWAWTKTDDFKKQMRDIVLAGDFLTDNFLSSEQRIPVTLLQTNACSPLATNALAGNIWDNFSSQSYKDLPSVGEITVHNPFTGEPRQYKMPAGGRGYTRPASLLSVWSTAPFLLNNSVGKFNPSPAVAARMESFNDSIHQLLWPETRDKDSVLGDKVPGTIDRTTAPHYFRIGTGYLPSFAPGLAPLVSALYPSVVGDAGVQIGPIPKGTPVNLLANIDLVPEDMTPGAKAQHDAQLIDVLAKLKLALLQLPANPTEQQALAAFTPLAEPLLKLSKCPDFVVNRGHYFGTSFFKEEPALSDDDKNALIEFLKTF